MIVSLFGIYDLRLNTSLTLKTQPLTVALTTLTALTCRTHLIFSINPSSSVKQYHFHLRSVSFVILVLWNPLILLISYDITTLLLLLTFNISCTLVQTFRLLGH